MHYALLPLLYTMYDVLISMQLSYVDLKAMLAACSMQDIHVELQVSRSECALWCGCDAHVGLALGASHRRPS